MKLTIVETPEFIKNSAKLFSDVEREELINYLSDYPEMGDIIESSGGLRKIRWSCKGSGKRGGARVIYFYYNGSMPLFLLTAFSKNQMIDITPSDKKQYSILLKQIVDKYR